LVPQSDELSAAARRVFDDWYDEFAGQAGERGVALLPISVQALFMPDEYERLIVLDLDDLSPEGE
jgi:hypothetical protein